MKPCLLLNSFNFSGLLIRLAYSTLFDIQAFASIIDIPSVIVN